MVVKSTLLACAMALVTCGGAMAARLAEAPPPPAAPKAPGQCFAHVGEKVYIIACENYSLIHKCGDKKSASAKWCVESRSPAH